MDHCLACGRELPPGQAGVCPECQAAGRGEQAKAKAMPPRGLTIGLIAANCGVFLLMVAMGADFRNPSAGHVFLFGGTEGSSVLYYLQLWRLWTSNYVHFGVVHLLLNMYCLWGLGRLVEAFYSRTDYLLLYTYTGIAGSVLGVFIHPFAVSAGASGAIFGLAGVLLTTLRFGNLQIPSSARQVLFKEILQFAGINLVLGLFILRVSNAGHIGGLLAGLVVGWAVGKSLGPGPESARRRWGNWVWLWLGLAVIFLGFRVLRVGWILPG